VLLQIMVVAAGDRAVIHLGNL